MGRHSTHRRPRENLAASVVPDLHALSSLAAGLVTLVCTAGAGLGVLETARLAADTHRCRLLLERHRDALLEAQAEAQARAPQLSRQEPGASPELTVAAPAKGEGAIG